MLLLEFLTWHLIKARKWRKIQFIFLLSNSVFMAYAAGAVSALAKFGAQNEEMLPSILVLLKR